MNLDEINREDRRLVILRTLKDSMGYTANESLLDRVLESYGHHVGRDMVRGDITWLKEQNLLSIEEPGGIMIATATRRGVEVGKGETVHPGVARPSASA